MSTDKEKHLHGFALRVVKAMKRDELKRSKETEAVMKEASVLNIQPNQVLAYTQNNMDKLKKESGLFEG